MDKKLFADMPHPARDGALALRALILETATNLGINQIEETLRWGQPSFIAPKGTALRIGATDEGFAIYAHCQSSVIRDFASQFGSEFDIDGNRAVRFKSVDDIKPNMLRQMITHALTYKTKR